MHWQAKLTGTAIRIGQAFRWLPRRLWRLGRHLRRFCWSSPSWYLEILYLGLDILAVPEVYETITDWLKWRTRPLTDGEQALLQPVFGDRIDYRRIRIDERAWMGPPQWKICYVSFYTINAWGSMSPSLLIHEVVHIWQFQHYGSAYIPRALQAQRSEEGYNYGGAPQVNNWARQGALLSDFNFEQQADLIADFWRLQHQYHPQWGPAGPADLPAYSYFAQQLLAVDSLSSLVPFSADTI